MEKEQWKEEVIRSLEGIRRAEPSPFLKTRIEAAIANTYRRATPLQLRLAAVVTALLLIVNGYFLFSNRQPQGNPPSGYQLNSHQYQIY